MGEEKLFGRRNYIVSVGIRDLHSNPRFTYLTEPGRKIFSDSVFIGRDQDRQAYYLTDESELGSLVRTLLEGVEEKTTISVRLAQGVNLPSNLKENVRNYFAEADKK
jgi:hypothetical protein